MLLLWTRRLRVSFISCIVGGAPLMCGVMRPNIERASLP